MHHVCQIKRLRFGLSSLRDFLLKYSDLQNIIDRMAQWDIASYNGINYVVKQLGKIVRYLKNDIYKSKYFGGGF